MSDLCILLRPEHKTEREKKKANGAGFRTGFVHRGNPPAGWVLVHAKPIPCYEREGDDRRKVKLDDFRIEVDDIASR